MKHKVFSVFPLVLAFAVAASAADVPFNYNFTATFSAGPVPTISGSFSGLFTPIIGSGPNASSLSSINLTILGVTYTVATAGVIVTNGHALSGVDFQGSFLTGGTLNGIGTVAGGTNDFGMQFNDAGNGVVISPSFLYTSTTIPGQAVFATNVSVARATGVPDSGSSLGLLSVGILSAMAVARRLRRKA